MKLTLLTLLVLLAQFASAQDTADHRLVIFMSGGALLSPHPGLNVAESFSYTSIPVATGVASTRQFSGSLSGNFPRVGYVGDIENFEVTGYNHAINGAIGLFQTSSADAGSYFKTRYARVLHWHRSKFRFEPGIDLYGVLGGQIEMGRIDNRAQTLQFLGYTAGPQWTVHYSDKRGYHSRTYSADYLSVLYRRDALLLQPKLALYVSFRKLVLGLQAGWVFQLSQGCLLLMQQADDNNDVNTIARFHQPHNGSASGLYTSLSIGLINRSRHAVSRSLFPLLLLFDK